MRNCQPRAAGRIAALAVLALLALAFAGASAANGALRTTKYYTIDVAPPSASSAGLFLGTQNRFPGDPVRLKRYASGDPSVQWTTTNLEWPGFSPVTSPLTGITSCSILPPACPFRGQGRPGREVKLVNRASGLCLTLPATRVRTAIVQGTCAVSGPRAASQVWRTEQFEVYYAFQQIKGSRCMQVAGYNTVGTPLQGMSCQSPLRWMQRFRLHLVSQATCEIGVTNDICGPRRGSAGK